MKKIKKLEKSQAICLTYIKKIGKWFLYILPLILVLITVLAILAFIDLLDYSFIGILIRIIFYGVAISYGFNSIILLIGGLKTDVLLEARLNYERKQGRPIDSLNGFKILSHNVHKVIKLLVGTAILCIITVILYVFMLATSILEIGYVAIGLTLFGLGLILLIRSLNLKINDINGLQDFYEPNIHKIFMDNLFGDVFSNHLDPVTHLKWDDFKIGISQILNQSFQENIKKLEKRELAITFAIERILYLYYLLFQEVITNQRFEKELKEIINIDSKKFDYEKGLLLEDKWYFSKKDIFKLFEFIKKYNPGFFNVIDRLQLELMDNIESLSAQKIYIDCSAQEIVYKNRTLNVMVYLFNNSPKSKRYRLRIVAPGFDPSEVVLKIKVEGRGTFKIPNQPLMMAADENPDIIAILSDMLENGDSAWITLEPRLVGAQTVQIFLENKDGEIIQGETRVVNVATNIKYYFRKLSSLGSILGGIATPLSRIFFII